MIYYIIGIIVLLVLILSLFGLALVMHRELFGKRFEPDGIVKYYEVKEFEGLVAKPIQFPMKKETLRGNVYFYPERKSKGVIVFSHGMWGSHRAYIQEMEALAKDGFLVVGYDNLGTELSSGKNLGGLGSSLACLDYAIRYVKKEYPNERIFVMGHSWGGFAASNIAKYHPDIAGIISMSGFVNVKRVLKSILPLKIYIFIPFLRILDFIYCGKYSFANAKRTLNKTKVETLLVHSKDDMLVKFPLNTGYLRRKVNNSHIRYLIVEGKSHNPDYSYEALAYTKEVTATLKKLSGEEREAYKREIDYHKMGELDRDIMEKLLAFLN